MKNNISLKSQNGYKCFIQTKDWLSRSSYKNKAKRALIICYMQSNYQHRSSSKSIM